MSLVLFRIQDSIWISETLHLLIILYSVQNTKCVDIEGCIQVVQQYVLVAKLFFINHIKYECEDLFLALNETTKQISFFLFVVSFKVNSQLSTQVLNYLEITVPSIILNTNQLYILQLFLSSPSIVLCAHHCK